MSDEIARPEVYIGFSWRRVIFGIAAGVVLITLAYLGFLFYLNQTSKTPNLTVTKTSSHSATKSATATTSAATSGWKTFQGQNYSFKYPPNWNFDNWKSLSGDKDRIWVDEYKTLNDGVKITKNFEVSLLSKNYTGNFYDWCNKDTNCNDSSAAPLIKRDLNSITIYQRVLTTDCNGCNAPISWVYFLEGKTIYKITWTVGKNNTLNDYMDSDTYFFSEVLKEFNDPVFEQMLSTFKFL